MARMVRYWFLLQVFCIPAMDLSCSIYSFGVCLAGPISMLNGCQLCQGCSKASVGHSWCRPRVWFRPDQENVHLWGVGYIQIPAIHVFFGSRTRREAAKTPIVFFFASIISTVWDAIAKRGACSLQICFQTLIHQTTLKPYVLGCFSCMFALGELQSFALCGS